MDTDHGPRPAPHVAALRQSLADLVAESQALRTDVNAAEKSRRRENLINIGLIGLLVVFVALVGVIAWQNNQIARQANQTNVNIADCTTIGHKCYDDSVKRTQAVVADLVRASVYVAECSRLHPGESGPTFDRAIEKCVADKLAAARK